MRKLFFAVTAAFFFSATVYSQDAVQAALPGYDVINNSIAHGNIDTISYYSKTIGSKRRALIYTPPGFTKKKKNPVLYLLHGIGGDEKEWLNGGTVWRNNLYNFAQVLFKQEGMYFLQPVNNFLLQQL